MTNTEKKNRLLQMLESKQIDMKDFLYRCALWGMETGCWVEYEVRPRPAAPLEWQEYVSLPLAKKAKVTEDFFLTHNIRDYLAKLSKNHADNYSDYSWLKDMKEKIVGKGSSSDELLLRRLDEKILEFDNWFNQRDPMVEKIKETFSATETLAYKD